MNKQRKITLSQIGLTLVLLISLVFRLLYAQKNTFDYDEGHWLMFGVLAAQGFTPYTEIFVGIPPLALLTIQLGATLFGNELSTRYPMLLYSLIGVAAIFWLVKRQAGYSPTLAGLLAAIFLSFNSTYFFQSTSIMAEVPALALALLSIALIEYYRFQPSYKWLVLSGAAFAASLLLKVLIIFLPFIIGLQLLTIVVDANNPLASLKDTINIKNLVKIGAVWLGGVLVIFIVFLLIYNPAAMYHQVIAFRTVLREAKLAQGVGIQQNIEILSKVITIHYLLLAIGAVLALLLVGRRNFAIWIWPLWFVAAGSMLLLHVPLRPRHTVILLPPLAALSGIAIASIVSYIARQLKPQHANWITSSTFVALSGLVFFNSILWLIQPPEQHSLDKRYSGRLSAAAFVQRITAPNECIIVDDQRFAFLVERLVPPYLSETSTARFSIGWLTADQIIEIANRYSCPTLIYFSNRFNEYTPTLQYEAMSLYSLRLVFGESAKTKKTPVYAIRMNTNQAPSKIINRSLDKKVLLKGVDITPSSGQAGQEITISTYWQTQQKLDRDYKIFLHIKDSQGRPAAIFDHYPFESRQDDLILSLMLNSRYLEGQTVEDFANYPSTGLIPTRLWIPGNTLKETITIPLPDTVPPGQYSISMGLYNEATSERLDVIGSDQNEITVGTIEVVE